MPPDTLPFEELGPQLSPGRFIHHEPLALFASGTFTGNGPKKAQKPDCDLKNRHMLDFEPVSSHWAEPAFVSNKHRPALPGRSFRGKKLPIEFEDEPRINTNRYEYRWTSFAATTSRIAAQRMFRTTSRPYPERILCILCPHNTGKASPNSSTRVDRQRRRGSASAGPCGSRRQGGRLPHRGETERHRTVVHAGGTPALPGGRLFQSLLLLEGAHAGLPVRRPCRCGTAVPLRGPSRSFVSLRGSLFFSFVSNKHRPLTGATIEPRPRP